MNAPIQAMKGSAAVGTARLSDEDFLIIARLVREDFGLNLQLNKKDMVISRLGRRVKDLGLPDFNSYVQLLSGRGGAEELRYLRSSLTTNVTRFFREDHHFALMRETVFPDLVARARAGGRMRIWSAGCSAGQEPYSLALTLLDICPDAPEHDILILATDVDPVILQTASKGTYPQEEAQAIPPSMRVHLTDCIPGSGGEFALGKSPRALIRFAELNLMGAWPMRGPMDVIFCRNVVIYFDSETQARLWSRFSQLMPIGGYLVMGHSERLTGPANECFARVGNNAYRKIANAVGTNNHAL